MGAIDYLRDLGILTKLEGDRLIVSPSSKLTPDVRSYIKLHRLELMAEVAANDGLTPQQTAWLTNIANLLGCSAGHLIEGGFIDSDDLAQQLGADPRQVAQLIKTNPEWNQ